MSARAWDRRRAAQWGERPSYVRWVPQHPGVDSPSMEIMLYGSYFTEKVWERPVVRARRLRAERFARRQRRRHVPRFHTARTGYEPLGLWFDEINRLAHSTALKPTPDMEQFVRERFGTWSLPDADPLADMQAVARQAEQDYLRSLGALHKTTTLLDECEITEGLDA